jgi:NADPH-dependent 2,4-dienoyl-CoA reductase/sulfur reductase-like enzyme
VAERARFTIDGRPAEAAAGESLLAALWNAGQLAVRTSAHGELRGPLCGMGTCFECRVTVDGEPHRRACLEPVRDGMAVATLGSAGEADAAVAGRAGGTLRGLRCEAASLAADVVVVGAGPAGIAAAVRAAEAGRSTLLIDEASRPGGQIWRGEPPASARPWLERLARSGATVQTGAAVVDAPTPGRLLVASGDAVLRVSYDRLVLATGARELFLPFPGWTLPGVVGAGGAQALVKAGAHFSGRRVVVAGSGPLLVAVAATLARAGARVVGIVEQAPIGRLVGFGAGLWRQPGKIGEAAGYASALVGVPYRTGAWVREALGGERLERVLVTDGRREREWRCDALACGFGLVPNLELPRLLGCETTADAVVVDSSQQTSLPRVFAAGEIVGVAGADHALASGGIAGLAAAGREAPRALLDERRRERDFGRRLARAFALRDEVKALGRPETVVCRCEDATLAAVEGAGSLREAKLRARAGMGPCQGRVCGSTLGALRGFSSDTVRPPLLPVPADVLAAGEPSTLPEEEGAPSPATRSA